MAAAAAVLVIVAIIGTVRAFPPSPVATVQTQPTATAQGAAVAAPALAPTAALTTAPTVIPTAVRAVAPAAASTTIPTAAPTVAPTAVPTLAPTAVPTLAPTAVPTLAPTVAPAAAPTVAPTVAPAAAPTLAPTAAPTLAPTAAPTTVPTAIPTAVPTLAPTAAPTIAPTAPPALAPTAPQTLAPTSAATAAPLPLLDETFASGPAGWPSSVTSSAYWDSNGYHLEPRVPGQFVAIAAPLGASMGNVSVTGLFRKTAGPTGGGYGVLVRAQGGPYDGNNQGGRFYVFEVGDKGEVGAWRREDTQWIDLLGWTPSAAVQPGNAENRIDVQANGSQFSFSVNGTQVAQLSDPTLSSGAVGVFTGGDGNQVLLERFEVSGL